MINRKKLWVNTALFAVILTIELMGCKKKDEGTPADTTAPVVKLKGSSSVVVSLNTSYVDSGASATDNHDGTLGVTNNITSNNPNVNRVKTYTITYTATDAAGNVGTATRTVRVKNDAEDYAGNYSVADTCNGIAKPVYTQILRVDSFQNNLIHFSLFANYTNNTGIYAVKNSLSNLEINPAQTAISIGTSTGGLCDVADHTFQTVNPSSLVINGFMLNYTDSNQCNSIINTCIARFTKL